MSKMCKKVLTVLLAAVMFMALAAGALAAETPSITFDGTNVNFQFGSDYTNTDLFDGFKGVMPGDKLEQHIEFTNSAKKYDYVKVYLSVIPHTDGLGGELTDDGTEVASAGNPMSENVAAKTTFNDMVAFLNQLEMQVYHNDKGTDNVDQLIYEAKLGNLGNLKTDNIYLGKFSYNETSDITVKLHVPETMGNEYANKIGEVDWVITVQGYTDGGGGGGDDGSGKKVTVRKVWVGADEADIPNSITVNLLNKKGKLVETVTLSKANNWTQTLKQEIEWSEVKDWTMEEIGSPEGYTVTTSKDNKSGAIILTITNTKGGDGPKDPEDPNKPTDPSNPGGGGETPGGDSGKPGDIGSTDTIIVNKVWSGDAASKRPESVSFTLYQNGVAYDVITVGEWNNWTYTWKDLDMNERWQVVEAEIAGYEAVYSLNGNVLTVTNVANSPETLIKTGQVNWPVLALGGAGALMMLAGVLMMAGKKRQNAR